MLSTSRILMSGLVLLATGLIYCADVPAAHAGLANLSRAGAPVARAAAPKTSLRTASDTPYSVSRNEHFESPEAVIKANRDCCADLDTASFVFATAGLSSRDLLSPSQRLIFSCTSLLAAHVLLRV